MADRFVVISVAVILAIALLVWVGSPDILNAPQTPQPTSFRGRVIDAATGEGIPGAYVVARYETTYGAHGQSGCPWMEGAKADDQGWFELLAHGKPILQAFSPGYVRARPKKIAHAEIREGKQVWYVAIHESDNGQESVPIIGREPGLYKTPQEAEAASRQSTDSYLRRARPSQDDYIGELRDLSGHPNCSRTRSARDVHGFLDAVHAEEIKVGAPKDNLEYLLGIKTRVREDDQGSR